MDVKGRFIFQQDDFVSLCFKSFQQMRREDQLIDFKVSCGNRYIVGHRLILAASVPYFHTIFSKSEGNAYLEEISSESLQDIVNFAYSGRVEITSKNVQSLIVASKLLNTTQIYDACWKFLEKGLDLNNVWKIREIAERYQRGTVIDIADRFIRENFEAFSKSEAFTALPVSYLNEVIRRDDVNVSSEESVCEAVIKWVKNSPENRGYLFKLFCEVRLSQLSFRYLTKLAISEDVLQTSIQCKELLKEAALFHSSPETATKFPCLIAGPRIYTQKPKDARTTCGLFAFSSSKFSLSARFLDLESGIWESLSIYPSCQVNSIVAFEGIVYVFSENAIVTLNLKTLNWCQLNVNYRPLSAPKNVVHYGKIYMLGVSGYRKGLVMCFDPRKNTFLKTEEMKRTIGNPGVASCTEYIYVTGGTSQGQVCETTERYDPHTNEWTERSPMLCRRWEHGCASLDDRIYVCGGYYGGLLQTAEIYNPLTDQWGFIRSLNTPHWEITLVPYNGKLYAYPRRPWFVKTSAGMEIYDPEGNEWISGANIPEVENCEIFLTSSETLSDRNIQGGKRTETSTTNKKGDGNKGNNWSPSAAECSSGFTSGRPRYDSNFRSPSNQQRNITKSKRTKMKSFGNINA